jgi:hypothetical protein
VLSVGKNNKDELPERVPPLLNCILFNGKDTEEPEEKTVNVMF